MAAVAQALLQIVVVAVLGRLLSPAEFGLAAIAGIVIDLAAGPGSYGYESGRGAAPRPQPTITFGPPSGYRWSWAFR